MENKYKFHKNSYKLLLESVSLNMKEDIPTKIDWSSVFFRCLQIMNTNALYPRLKKLDAKFPQRRDGTTVLETTELENIVYMFEKLSSHFHKNKTSNPELGRIHAKSLVKRLGDYFVVISEYVEMIAGLDIILVDFNKAVQQIRKELRHAQ